jgi:hypothetical protein
MTVKVFPIILRGIEALKFLKEFEEATEKPWQLVSLSNLGMFEFWVDGEATAHELHVNQDGWLIRTHIAF